MEPERAQELLTRERERIEAALHVHGGESPLEGDERVEPGDTDDEALFQDELDEGRSRDLRQQLAAVDRAQARLRDGSYGLSVRSGKPIPDGRLEARPTAELTVEEEQDA